MYKVQIFNFIVNKTASECNVTPEEIRSSSHRADIVDARCIAYRLAVHEEGFTPREISIIMGRGNPKAVRELVNSFEERYERSRCFKNIYNKIAKEIETELF